MHPFGPGDGVEAAQSPGRRRPAQRRGELGDGSPLVVGADLQARHEGVQVCAKALQLPEIFDVAGKQDDPLRPVVREPGPFRRQQLRPREPDHQGACPVRHGEPPGSSGTSSDPG